MMRTLQQTQEIPAPTPIQSRETILDIVIEMRIAHGDLFGIVEPLLVLIIRPALLCVWGSHGLVMGGDGGRIV